MVLNLYSTLLDDDRTCISEKPGSYATMTERHLQAMWFEQKYFRGLATVNGQPIHVVSPGIWNGEAGPDFKKAHLRIGDREMRGDVEIHLFGEGWTQHKHHTDPRYDDVVLHLSLWQKAQQKELITSKGNTLQQASFERHLTIPLARIVDLIDLDLYPYHTYAGTGRCAEQLFRRMRKEEIVEFFLSAAEHRLRQKAASLAAYTDKKAGMLSLGIAAALGYKSNTKGFVEIYSRLSELKDASEKELFARALGDCGFFSGKYPVKWESCAYYRDLHSVYMRTVQQNAAPIPLVLHQIRPFNHPVRRLFYLIKMLRDPEIEERCAQMMRSWEKGWGASHGKREWNKLFCKLTETIPSYEDPYWNRHFIFGGAASEEFLPLIGAPLAKIIVINSFFPILICEIMERSNPEESRAFLSFFSSLKSEGSGKSVYLRSRFFGNAPNGRLLELASMEQGAYQLHKDFCLHYEASCEGCPFVDRYLRNRQTNGTNSL